MLFNNRRMHKKRSFSHKAKINNRTVDRKMKEVKNKSKSRMMDNSKRRKTKSTTIKTVKKLKNKQKKRKTKI